jgi:pimeloyl-ACP methyl ester carboxylesterase
LRALLERAVSTGIPGDALFGSPSPILPLHLHVAEQMHGGIRTDLMNYDEMPDLTRLKPDRNGEPTILIGHSFGGETAFALAMNLPRIADKYGWLLGEIGVVSLDGVKQAEWWSPWRSRFDPAACIARVFSVVRDAMVPPYSSSISGEDGNWKRQFHRPQCDHNSIVAEAEEDVLKLCRLMFWGRET